MEQKEKIKPIKNKKQTKNPRKTTKKNKNEIE